MKYFVHSSFPKNLYLKNTVDSSLPLQEYTTRFRNFHRMDFVRNLKHDREEIVEEEENSVKKFKTSHESNDDLTSSIETESEGKDEEEDRPSSEDAISQHANDHIYLNYHTPTTSQTVPSSSFRLHPNFTHQLFPNEMISYISREEIHRLSIQIHINTCNLQHYVHIHGSESSDITSRLKQDLALALPSDVIYCDTANPQISLSNLSPVGKLVHSFTLPTSSKDSIQERHQEHYEVYLATYKDEHANDLLIKLEKIAMWFIETADSVDFSDPRWEILVLYQKHLISSSDGDTTTIYSIVGYITLFTFHNPFHGDNLRVCQALIFPQKQHSGLGRELLLCVYRIADERKNVNQVTVEDPSPGFQRLRNAVDFEWYVLKCSLREELQKLVEVKDQGLTKQNNEGDNEVPPPLSNSFNDASIVSTLSEKLKITKAQAIFVKEAFEYIEMIYYLLYYPLSSGDSVSSPLSPVPIRDKRSGSVTSSSSSAPVKLSEKDKIESQLAHLHESVSSHNSFPEFRLAVKKNIVKNDAELKQLPKLQLQKELSVAFEEKMMKYRAILNTALRLQLIRPSHLVMSKSERNF